MIFGNPLGLWALAGVPVILAIHFFQRQSRTIPISTMFLLERLSLESVAGRKFEWLRNSLALWLQLATVLVLTWLLVDPRWLLRESVQRVVLLLDSSVSMSAFRESLDPAVFGRLAQLGRLAGQTEWIVLQTDTRQHTLYSGRERRAAEEAVRRWQPHLGSHDFEPAIRLAQTLIGRTGTIVLVTDHLAEVPAVRGAHGTWGAGGAVPEGVEVLAVGAPVDNVGLSGVQVESEGPLAESPPGIGIPVGLAAPGAPEALIRPRATWRALITNFGASRQKRSWWVESGRTSSSRSSLSLAPGESLRITGEFPGGESRLTVVLEPDRFILDDRLPLVRPLVKPLSVAVSSDFPAKSVVAFVLGIPGVKKAAQGEPVDLYLTSGVATGAAVVWPKIVGGGRYRGVPPVADRHPLMEDLNWEGLLLEEVPAAPVHPADQVLLWQGKRPVIWLRDSSGGDQLVLHLPSERSNFSRLPAGVLLLHRFVESLRAKKVAYQQANYEAHQMLDLAVTLPGPAVVLQAEGSKNPAIEVPAVQAAALRAPSHPGFFSVKQGKDQWLDAASQFADAREADFKNARWSDAPGPSRRAVVELNSRRDPWAPWWWLVVIGLSLGQWAAQRRKRS